MSTEILLLETKRAPTEDMFADLGVPLVVIDNVAVGEIIYTRVTFPIDLTAAQILRGRIRLLTATATAEATLVAAVDALEVLEQVRADALAYAAIPAPTAEQAVAATTALAGATAQLAGDVRGLIEWVGRDALDLGH